MTLIISAECPVLPQRRYDIFGSRCLPEVFTSWKVQDMMKFLDSAPFKLALARRQTRSSSRLASVLLSLSHIHLQICSIIHNKLFEESSTYDIGDAVRRGSGLWKTGKTRSCAMFSSRTQPYRDPSKMFDSVPRLQYYIKFKCYIAPVPSRLLQNTINTFSALFILFSLKLWRKMLIFGQRCDSFCID